MSNILHKRFVSIHLPPIGFKLEFQKTYHIETIKLIKTSNQNLPSERVQCLKKSDAFPGIFYTTNFRDGTIYILFY